VSSIAHRGFVHLGMDVSKDAIAVAVLAPDRDTAEVDKIFHDTDSVRRLVNGWGARRGSGLATKRARPVMTSNACLSRWACVVTWWLLPHPEGFGRSGQDRPQGRQTTGGVAPGR